MEPALLPIASQLPGSTQKIRSAVVYPLKTWLTLSLVLMTRTNIPGTSPYEPIIGFSRAVRIGNHVYVSGTGPVGADDASPAEQTRAALAIIKAALEKAGASLEHVYRTRIFLARAENWEEIGR